MATGTILSKMSIHGHPVHPMVIHFPVAALLGVIATDLAYLATGDFFWARGGLWLVGVGALGGWVSGVIGLLDLLIVAPIRRLITAWCHAIMAVMLLSLASLNWLIRVETPEAHILPWGIYLSLLGGVMISLASVLGGQLVYDHAVGVASKTTTGHRGRDRGMDRPETN